MKQQLDRAAGILGVFCILMIAANLFTFPFPFVRAVWIREVWGITGLIHAVLFYVISRRIVRASLAAPLAGIGLIINYLILTCRGFQHVFFRQEAHLDDWIFFLATALLGFFLNWMFLDIFKIVYKARFQKNHHATDPQVGKLYDVTDSGALIVSAVGYVFVFGMLYMSFSLDEAMRYGSLKLIASLISPLSMGGIGQEIDYYLHNKQSRFFCIVKSSTHLLILIGILWIVYRLIPISSVVI